MWARQEQEPACHMSSLGCAERNSAQHPSRSSTTHPAPAARRLTILGAAGLVPIGAAAIQVVALVVRTSAAGAEVGGAHNCGWHTVARQLGYAGCSVQGNGATVAAPARDGPVCRRRAACALQCTVPGSQGSSAGKPCQQHTTALLTLTCRCTLQGHQPRPPSYPMCVALNPAFTAGRREERRRNRRNRVVARGDCVCAAHVVPARDVPCTASRKEGSGDVPVWYY